MLPAKSTQDDRMPQYLSKVAYAELVAKFLAADMDALDRENSIKILLGEVLDVWPETIQASLP
jgi:hypothetical protein